MIKELLSLALIFSAASANASTQYLFGFDYHGNFVSGYGSIYGTDNGDGTYTAIDGVAYQTIGGLTQQLTLVPNPDGPNQSVSPAGAFTFDDQILLGSSPQLSGDGLLFMSPNQEINLASVVTAGLVSYRYYEQNLFSEDIFFEIVLALPGDPGPGLPAVPVPIPEPTSYALILIGIGALASVRTSATAMRALFSA